MKKKSMDDPIKRKWRNREYAFISRHRKDLRRPKDWVIAFLPGSDAGFVPTELEMFERLGAQRSNLVGIEKDKNIYKKLKSRKLGINLEWADTEHFFKNVNTKFDIISLDYSGQFSHQVVNTLKFIAGRQSMNERAILTTNFYGRMEQPDVMSEYIGGLFSLHADEILDHEKSRKCVLEDWKEKMLIETFGNDRKLLDFIKDVYKTQIEGKTEPKKDDFKGLGDFFKRAGYDNLEKIRKVGITSSIVNFLLSGKELLEINPVYLRNPNFKELENILLDIYFRIKSSGDKNFDSNCGIEVVDKFSIHKGAFGDTLHQMDLVSYLLNKGYLPDMMHLVKFFYSHPYFVEDLESYWYRSEKGSPMYSDFFCVDQYREMLEKYKEFAEKVYIDLEDGPLTAKKIDEDLKELFKEGPVITSSRYKKFLMSHLYDNEREFSKIRTALENLHGENLPKRIFLGSSADRPKLDGKTYYKHRQKSIEKGQDRENLWESLKAKFKTNLGQLRAYERHFNMETYGPKEVVKPVQKKNYDSRSYKVIDLFKCSNPVHYLENGLLPKGAVERLHHFIEEDLPFRIEMGKEKKNQLVKNIAETNWYKRIKKNLEEINNIKNYKERKMKRETLEKQVYTFFDDIMLYCIWNEKVPDKEKIKGLLHDSLQGGKILPERPKKLDYVPESKKGGEEMSPKGRPYISKEAALALLKIGQEPQEIASSYRGFTAGQLRAFKAHTTMNTYGDGELTDNLAYELFSKCGLETSEVATAFPKESRHRIGAYKAWVTMGKRGK